MPSDGKSYKPLDAKTGKVHECPNEGWSKQKTCFGCGQSIIFHNSHMYNGKKIRFDFPGVRHSCTQQSYDYQSNSEDDSQPNEKQKQQYQYQEPQDYEKIWEELKKQREQRQKQRREQKIRKIYDRKVIEAYAVFELNHNATLEQIKSTFREFALKYHPDKNKSPSATATMVKINCAYEVIVKWWKNHD